MKHLLKDWKRYMSETKKVDSKKVAKAIMHSGGEFLALQNDEETLDLPGGHLLEEEEELEGLAREVKEETQLDIDVSRAHKLMERGRTTFYLLPLPGQPIKTSKEHRGYRRIKFEDYKNYNFSKGYGEAVQRAKQTLEEEQ
jgi:8-oxo-dGTP pyrophosphatase MutT (NUDIX family)|tara:strand:- start:859 stop:1281 length:423 start_codon:yes stop_codon:yes gene_type:complete